MAGRRRKAGKRAGKPLVALPEGEDYSRLRLLAVDPGRDKCGLAVVDRREGVLARGVVPVGTVGRMAADWARAYRPALIVMGSGTALRGIRQALAEIELPLEIFPEAHTTERARRRYFQEHPPRGLWRLAPGLRTPPIPIDDYAAVIIAEDYFAAVAALEERGGR